MSDLANDRRSRGWLRSLVLFLVILFLVAATSKDYGVTWDEPPYFTASDLHSNWIKRLVDTETQEVWAEVLDDEVIRAAWRWNPYNVPHPPFSRIVSGLFKAAATPMLDEISAYRLGPALFFALLATLMFRWMSELFGTATGSFSALALVLMPNLFGYAHFAVTDMPLAAMWFATTYCFYKGLSDWRWSLCLGVVWGLAISTKFPALLAVIPLVLWAHAFHRDKYINNLFAMLFLAPVVMVATQPYLWHQTGLRALEFLYEGISRGYRAETNFGVFFANQVLSSHQLPWYYPFFLIGVTTPEPILLSALLGIIVAWKKEHRAILALFLLNAAFILILGTMPGAVMHDGVRQLLASLPFIAALAGVGLQGLATWLHAFAQRDVSFRAIANLRIKVYTILFLVFSVSPALDLYLIHPYQLSFYNRFVGGVSGAYERGLETTYFLEALTPDLVENLNEKLPNNAVVNATFANTMLAYYQQRRVLRQDLKITANTPYDFLILLNRRSALRPHERTLIDSATRPYIAIRLAGVPLVSAFDLRQFRKN